MSCVALELCKRLDYGFIRDGLERDDPQAEGWTRRLLEAPRKSITLVVLVGEATSAKALMSLSACYAKDPDVRSCIPAAIGDPRQVFLPQGSWVGGCPPSLALSVFKLISAALIKPHVGFKGSREASALGCWTCHPPLLYSAFSKTSVQSLMKPGAAGVPPSGLLLQPNKSVHHLPDRPLLVSLLAS